MDLIAIGRISKPIGTRGGMKIFPLTDDNLRFAELKSVWIGKDTKEAERRNINLVQADARQVIVNLEGVQTPEEVNKLKDKYLFIPKEQAVELQAGNYFIDDLIGCEVITEENEKIGIVSDLLKLPANDMWVVRNGSKEFLVPAVKSIIREVDVKMKRITIKAIEGLLE
ncbi:MAG: 16S rRNA processing protein RimM [Bacteroidetes bacterium]|nr:16S rRNA processing protein RimM [Bacteroidota bacterium]